MTLLTRFFLFILFSLLFFFLIYFTPAPASWIEASTQTILTFFILLLLVVTTLSDIFLNYLPRSFVIGLGFLMLSVQLTLGSLNYTTSILTILATLLLFFFTPKKLLSRHPRDLTSSPKTPRLSHKSSPMRKLKL